MHKGWLPSGLNLTTDLTTQTPLLSGFISNHNYKYSSNNQFGAVGLQKINSSKVINTKLNKNSIELNQNQNINQNPNQNPNPNPNPKKEQHQNIIISPDDPSTWGPSFWRMIHTIAAGYDENISQESKLMYKNQLEILTLTLPCSECRNNWQKILQEYPITNDILQNKYTFSKWTFDVHNIVNDHTESPQFSIQDFLIQYPTLRHGFLNHEFLNHLPLDEQIIQRFIVFVELTMQDKELFHEKLIDFYKFKMHQNNTILKSLQLYLSKFSKNNSRLLNITTRIEQQYLIESFITQILEDEDITKISEYFESKSKQQQLQQQQSQSITQKPKKKCGCKK
jgi:hypothetical protein